MSTFAMPNNINSFQLRGAWFGENVVLANEHKTIGSVLKEQWDKYDGTSEPINQGLVAQDMEINQSTLSRIQNDRAPKKGGINLLTPEQTVTMLKGYRIPEEEFVSLARKFHLRLPVDYISNNQKVHNFELNNSVIWSGDIGAGNGSSYVSDEQRRVYVPTWIAERFNLDDVFAATVRGTSMVCEEIHKTIPEGATAYFHKTLEPHPGDIVCCYLELQDIQVIKLYKPEKNYTLLESYNPAMRDEPIVIDKENPGKCQGLYLTHEIPAKRFRS